MNRLADLLPGVVAELAATHTATHGEPPMTENSPLADLLVAARAFREAWEGHYASLASYADELCAAVEAAEQDNVA